MTWTVEWRRAGEDEWLTCTDLDERTAFARLLNALRHSDHVEVRSATRSQLDTQPES